jgi:hypothetical protein
MASLPQRICLLLVAAAFGAAGAAPALARERVAVVVVPSFPLGRYAAEGAVGLLVPGSGSTVTRAGSLAALVRGKVRSSLLGGPPRGEPLIRLAPKPGPVTIYVALPPPGPSHNVRRYPIAVVGGGYRGLLVSSATRVPGLVSIADVAPAAVALGAGKRPRLGSRPAADAPAELRRLDRRLAAAHDARAPVRVAVVLLLGVAFLAALALRSRTAARAGLLVGPAALATALALSAAHEARLGVAIPAVVASAAVAALVARRGDRALAVAVAALALLELVVLVRWPEVNALAAIGPHPDGGGRYYGVTNEVETLLLAPTLAAAAVLGPLAALPALILVGWSRAGADGGGLLVFALALAVLRLRLSGRRLTPRLVALAVAAAVALALVIVAIDAATGGASHVTDAIGSGPGSLAGDVAHRWHVSWAGATSSPGVVAMSLAGLGGLVVFALLRPRSAVFEALVAGMVVSLLVNDTPQDVLAFGGLTGASLWAWEWLRPAPRRRAPYVFEPRPRGG